MSGDECCLSSEKAALQATLLRGKRQSCHSVPLVRLINLAFFIRSFYSIIVLLFKRIIKKVFSFWTSLVDWHGSWKHPSASLADYGTRASSLHESSTANTASHESWAALLKFLDVDSSFSTSMPEAWVISLQCHSFGFCVALWHSKAALETSWKLMCYLSSLTSNQSWPQGFLHNGYANSKLSAEPILAKHPVRTVVLPFSQLTSKLPWHTSASALCSFLILPNQSLNKLELYSKQRFMMFHPKKHVKT